MKSADVRKKYIEFFKIRGHVEIPSAPLVPENDPTTLFTSSGMQPLIPYLLGQPHPAGKRLVNSQKSFRSQDIDEVGDNRHTTFFEMLGNWSLGDPARNASHSDAGGYFKKEQLSWFWEFLTKELELPRERLYVSVFKGVPDVPRDEESADIWRDLGVPRERIFYYGVEKNWWSRSGIPDHMPVGEIGGPDSEIFFEFDSVKHDKKFGKTCHPNCDCGRFSEIGNSVFIQYKKTSDGKLEELPQKNVDFGGGLERMVAATEDSSDVFETDLFSEIIKTVEEYSDKTYSKDESKAAIRIITDHLKAATFLIVDGVIPSNKTQGYILRRLLRRAAVKMHQLKGGLTPIPGFIAICESVLRIYEGVYFNRSKDLPLIERVIEEEMDRFSKSLDKGLKEFDKASTEQLNTLLAFNLFQTHGFPYEITEELFKQKGKTISKVEFDEIYKAHQDLSRTASKGMFAGGLADHSEETTKLHTAHHLLLASLQKIVDPNIKQRGSNITAERLRMDFNFARKLSDEELKKVEELVNQKIAEDLPIKRIEMDRDEAEKIGAQMEFDHKYPDRVNVYFVGLEEKFFSAEFCGGPHVEHTGILGHFKIIKEESISAGVRRIYAVLQ